MAIQKTYQYAVSNHGRYLGLLPNVTSDFQLNQAINSVGAQLQVTVAQTTDVAGQSADNLQAEDNSILTDELGNNLQIEHQPDIVGDLNSNALIVNDNDIIVTEYSSYHPNGVVVFSGYISKWKVDYGNDTVVITCLTQSQDLGNYLIPGSNALVADKSFTTNNDMQTLISLSGGGTIYYPGSSFALGQYIPVGNSTTNIGAITMSLMTTYSGACTATVQLWTSDAQFTFSGGLPLGTATLSITQPSVSGLYQFVFPVPAVVTPGSNVFLTLSTTYTGGSSPGSGPIMDVFGTLSGGTTVYRYQTQFGNDTISGQEMYYQSFTSTESTATTFTNTDPSTILTTIMNGYISAGGSVAKPPGGYNPAGSLITYTFKLNTMLQGIQQVQQQGPQNWYFYVDPATNILYYQPSNTVADFTFIKGRHINALTIEATKETIANNVYFSGGDDGTGHNTTIFVNVTNQQSILNNRLGLVLLSDNRVNSTTGGVATGTQIAQSYINQHSAETYVTNVTIQDSTTDTSLFKLGQMIGFSGFGNFTESLLLQIVGINYNPNQVVLSLGTLPKRATAVVESILGQLEALQTVANPNSPS